MSLTPSQLRALAFEAVHVAENAALAASRLVGRGDKIAADQAAVDHMRQALNDIAMQGRIVIGEGERDEAPMLYIGEEVGTGEGPAIDIALDPLEGTSLTAKAMPNALAVLALAPRGGLLHAPDTYMDKIAIGPGYPDGTISLEASVTDNLHAIAKAKGERIENIGVCILERERHEALVEEVRAAGARIFFIPDGDVAGVINTTDPATGIDLYVGQGGAPEGVLAAAALRCVGGQMQGRLFFRNDDARARAERIGVSDLDKVYDLKELASGEWAIFAATGVTPGVLVEGVERFGGRAMTETLLMTSFDSSTRHVRSERSE